MNNNLLSSLKTKEKLVESLLIIQKKETELFDKIDYKSTGNLDGDINNIKQLILDIDIVKDLENNNITYKISELKKYGSKLYILATLYELLQKDNEIYNQIITTMKNALYSVVNRDLVDDTYTEMSKDLSMKIVKKPDHILIANRRTIMQLLNNLFQSNEISNQEYKIAIEYVETLFDNYSLNNKKLTLMR